MAGGIYYEKSFAEDKDDTIMGLVDYSSSSDDEYPPPSQKRNRLTDSGTYTSSHSHASEDEKFMCATRGNKQRLTDSASNSPLRGSSKSSQEEEDDEIHINDYIDSDDEEERCETDWDVLKIRPVDWIAVDKYNLPEVYAVILVEGPRVKSKCLELLDAIGCCNRFLGLSVEMGRTFFANLNKDEAAMLKAIKGISKVHQYRLCAATIQ